MTKMDSLGMGLGAALDELAAPQFIELHLQPTTIGDQDSGLTSIKSGLLRCGILTRLLTG
jgi:hypothetical protein